MAESEGCFRWSGQGMLVEEDNNEVTLKDKRKQSGKVPGESDS